MTIDPELSYWKSNPEWYRINAKGEYELTEKATERARKSFLKANTPRKERKNPFL